MENEGRKIKKKQKSGTIFSAGRPEDQKVDETI